MTGVEVRTVVGDETNMRLDRWFKLHFPDVTHGRIEKLLRTGQIRVDGKRAKAGQRLDAGAQVRVPPGLAGAVDRGQASGAKVGPGAEPKISRADAAALQAAILYKDDDLIALNKPPGLAVQGGSGQARHLDAMLAALRFGATERPRLVHRLDKDTSGVLILARNRRAATALTAAFKGQAVRKIYWAAVAGVPKPYRGSIDLPVAKRATGGRERMTGDRVAGQPAVTHYVVAGRFEQAAAWLALSPETGRTHQLRVHCAAIGHPILGDGKYGGRAAFPAALQGVKALQLHAREIAVPHPRDGTTVRVTAPLPPHMDALWETLGFDLKKGEAIADDLVA